MDTKLKNVMCRWYFKAVAYLVLVACVIGTCTVIWSKSFSAIDFDVVGNEFENYYPLYEAISSYTEAVIVAETYNSMEEIKEGTYEDEIKDFLYAPYQNWINCDGMVNISTYFDENRISFNYEHYYSDYDEEDYGYAQEEAKDLSYEAFLKQHPSFEETVRNAYIDDLVKEYEQSFDVIKDETRFVYAVGTKENEENLIKEFESYPLYGYVKENGIPYSNANQLSEILQYRKLPDKSIFIGMSKAYYDEELKAWNEQKAQVKELIETCLLFMAIGVLALLFLVVVTGKRPKEEKLHFYAIDKIWSEIYWMIGIFSGAGMLAMVMEIHYNNIREQWLFNLWLSAIVAIGTLLLVCILTQVRRLKARKFLDGFICFRISKKIYEILMTSWHRGKLSKRAIALAILLPILCATWVGAPFVIAFLIYIIYKYMGDFNEITEGTQKIKEGQLNFKIQVKNEDGALGKLANNINSLSQGLDAAVSNELRSQRLKAELISNVSHDIKTPLTSIVTYVDLLKQENIENEAAKDYIDVIDRKAQRLTVLTSDLFEAAKASSGDMPVNLERVDLNAIIRQALGEFDERIQNANLEVRTKLPESEAYIYADGKLTWRVLENLLSNVVKYGQSGSRVYMQVEDERTEICFTMKNISAYELNIPADELMERFKRGDDSRNSEGSGLGLSIANSLVTLQHGSFKIDVDGDLFKVTIRFERYREPKN